MKKMYKAMLLVLCAVLLVSASVLGTLAYLQAKTDTMTNTFAAGQVGITLQEYSIRADGTCDKSTVVAANSGLSNIKMVPGRTIEKIPFITVTNGSENCYLFVKVENNLTAYGEIVWADGWNNLEGDIWYYEKVKNAGEEEVFKSFKCGESVKDYTGIVDPTIKITAYAVQAEGFATAELAWNASGFGG